uniref:Uncharacterized protein n=1 Tax=Gadus morhua TaxID=8049 RepID=A0A8C5AQ66_GADMO
IERTHSSSFPMSVSSSHCLTSNKMDDFAMRAGFLAFLAAYSVTRCCLIFSASVSSSSLPNRSKSSSSLTFVQGAAGADAAATGDFSRTATRLSSLDRADLRSSTTEQTRGGEESDLIQPVCLMNLFLWPFI